MQDIVKKYRHERSVPDFYVSLFTNDAKYSADTFSKLQLEVLNFIYHYKVQLQETLILWSHLTSALGYLCKQYHRKDNG